ncbi:hypothetical protein IMG5_079920, partial [Ichthyophthirius multifiliis]
LCGQLIGHQSIVTAIQQIINTQMIVSADDQGDIKLWDLRTFSCLQSIQLKQKQIQIRLSIFRIIESCVFQRQEFLLLIFKKSKSIPKIKFKNNQLKLLMNFQFKYLKIFIFIFFKKQIKKINFDNDNQEFLVCTKKDLRIYEGKTGKIQKLVKGLVETEENNELTQILFINNYTQYITGDEKGQISIYFKDSPINKIVFYFYLFFKKKNQIKIEINFSYIRNILTKI